MIYVDEYGRPHAGENALTGWNAFLNAYADALVTQDSPGRRLAYWEERGTRRNWRGVALIEFPDNAPEHYRNFHLKAIPGAHEYATKAAHNLNCFQMPVPGHYLRVSGNLYPIAANTARGTVQVARGSVYGHLSRDGAMSYSGSLYDVFDVQNAQQTGDVAEARFWFFRPDQLTGAHMGITMSSLVPIWELSNGKESGQ